MGCPDPNLIAELAGGGLPEADRAGVDAHLRECELCRRLVSELRQAPPLAQGAVIGRYVVERQVGAGAMGAVYAAHDPELERKVAVKLLHEAGDQTRLVAEGRAMARLAHPNVVPVLDLGASSDGRAFVVMELVDGVTLRAWLAAAPRSWQQIVSVLLEAGRGLCAAHAVGITHRDFKPENLLLGSDGRTRVTDFGLARSGVSPGMARVAGATVTRTGEIAGTPAYMSPEQFRAQPAGAASDQFSFCVVLWEALYGARPFDDGALTMEALAEAVLAGRVQEPPKSAAPPALRRILQRGLAAEPEARFPSLEALLAELQKLGQRRRRWQAALALGLAALLVAGGGLAYRHRQSQLCHVPAGLWTPARRDTIGERFRSSGVSYAAATWPHVAATLDGYARELDQMRADSCEATELERSQPRDIALLRSQCLDEKQAQLGAFLAVLEQPTAKIVERAAQGAEGLARVSECGDLKRLLGPLRVRPEAAAADETLRKRFAVVRAQDLAGAVGNLRSELTAILQEAHDLGDRSLEAQALVLRSSREYKDGALKEALDSARAAVTAAEEGRDDRTRALAWIWQVPLSEDAGSLPEARRSAKTAQAVLTRVPAEEELQAQLEVALGTVEQNVGSAKLARDHFERALSLIEHQLGADSSKLPEYFGALVVPSMILGDYDAAQRYLDRELASIARHRGNEHPSYAFALVTQASLELTRGRPDRAIPLAEEGLARLERAYGSGAQLVEGLDILNSSLRAVGRVREALPVAQRLFDLGVQSGPESNDALLGLVTIGGTEIDARRFDAAERALDRVVAAKAPPPPILRKARVRLAQVYVSRRDLGRARRACEDAMREASPDDEWDWLDGQHCFVEVDEAEGALAVALERWRKLLAVEEKNHVSAAPSGMGEDIVSTARVLQRLHQNDEAVRLYERALAAEPAPPAGVIDSMVEARLGLAQALPDRARACRLAKEAFELLAKQELPRPERAAAARKLLAGCR